MSFRTQRANILVKYGRFEEALLEYNALEKGGTSSMGTEEFKAKIDLMEALRSEAIEAEELFDHDEDYSGSSSCSRRLNLFLRNEIIQQKE